VKLDKQKMRTAKKVSTGKGQMLVYRRLALTLALSPRRGESGGAFGFV
jgi:hypothetical protein